MRFRALDSFRGIAATLVVLYHAVFLGALNDNAFVRAGYLCVDFFFVLSGFVIAFAYGERLTGPPAASGFLIRRLGRLWPLHATMLLAFAGAEGLNHLLAGASGGADAFRASLNDNTAFSFAANAAMLNAVGLTRSISWNGASWSIGAEFCAYLVFVAVALWGGAGRLGLAGGLSALGGVTVFLLSDHHPLMDATYDLGFARCLYGFFLGVLVHALFVARGAGGRALPAPTALEGLSVGAAVLFMTLAGQGRAAILAPFVFALVVYVFAHEAGALSRLLVRRPFAALGAWSYSIYMAQGLVANAYARAVPLADRLSGLSAFRKVVVGGRDYFVAAGPGGTLAADALNLILIALALGASAFTFRFVEEPARKAFNRIAARVEAGEGAVAAAPAGAR